MAQHDGNPPLVELLDATGRVDKVTVEWLSAHCVEVLRRLRAGGQVRVRIIDDAEMARAHEEFAGVPGTTDVLTFDMTDPETSGSPPRPLPADVFSDTSSSLPVFAVDVDILICLDEARRQAQARGYRFDRELLLYVVHGVLHCLGHDDHEEAEAALMHSVEDAVLEAVGVGAVFRVGRSEHGGGDNGQAARDA